MARRPPLQPIPPLHRVIEAARVAALHSYGQPDRETAAAMAGIARQAAGLLPVPVALVSLIGDEWQEIVAAHGTDVRAIPRALSLCGHTIAAPDCCLIVPDLAADARFQDHALVEASPGVRFYAGVGLVDADGYVLGTISGFAALPFVPDQDRIDGLRHLATDAMAVLTRQRTRLKEQYAGPPDPPDPLSGPPPASLPSWLGVRTEHIAMPHSAQEGRQLVSVAPGSPARKAGLRPGDIIVALEGRATRRRRDLTTALARFAPGETVQLQVWRNGELSDHAVVLTPKPPSRQPARWVW